ncbi:3-ketoacyl-CoA thiolase A, peroxisomal [Vanrija pseudolonga]|uniref:3-ketoacyl-CoA thiolase A, peroxisomal n=1 Tax=Vanrija pseudolonga TaxID=143232 RepID=A0AAF1BGI9_9TREE|nr:3-ketoacyl-CoA thiolase A, peroxisomal [Vanrija pseudolonga]
MLLTKSAVRAVTGPLRPLGALRNYARPSGLAEITKPRPDDVVITFAKRTPLTRAKKGLLAHTSSDALIYKLFKSGLADSGVDPKLVEDIIVGTCHPPSPAYEVRAASLAAGFPETTPAQAINRLCGSGLMAIRHISDSIRVGDIDVGVAAGYESMSSHARPTPVFKEEAILASPPAVDCAKPMGWTSEMLALEFDVSRAKQDKYGLLSHHRASAAQKAGKFDAEIIPVSTTVPSDPEDPASAPKSVTVTQDDGMRHGLTAEKMASAKPAFKGMGDERSTGPNSSQVTDGAAMVVMMRRKKAEELGLPVLATHIATSVVGVTPKIMGVGPVYAIPAVLERAGLTTADVDLYEINEAFGSMYAYCVEKLGLDINKVNVNGGAIALGHPLGATGVRQVVTGVNELRREGAHDGKKILCTSMCIGSGMGAAGIFTV